MPRIQPIQVTEADDKTRKLLEGVQRALGMVPNMMKTMGHSPAALSAYLNFSGALSTALNPALREQISLAIAGANHCNYCASAHTALGANAGVDADEMASNLRGESADAKTLAAIRFAQAVIDTRGFVRDQDLADIRDAGYSDAQIVEIIALVSLNLFTNYFNHIAETEIDFPVVETAGASA